MRALRALVPAVTCTLFALTGHLAAGDAPALPLLVVVLLLVTGFFTVLAGAQRSLGQVLAALLVGQLGFHAAFSIDEWHRPAMPNAAGVPAFDPAAAGHGLTAVLTDPAMAAGHALAAVAAAFLLTRGDAALWAAFRLLARLRSAGVRPAPLRAAAPPRLRVVTGVRRVFAGVDLTRSLPRRGPPDLLAA
jgi:hypothetical protein